MMDGTEFGGACVAAGVVLKTGVDWVTARWKGRNDAKRLELQQDQQAADNDSRAVPAYQELVATLMASQAGLSTKLDTVEAAYTLKLQALQDAFNTQAVKLGILEYKMGEMSSKLAEAAQQKIVDTATITHLNSEVDRLTDERDDAQGAPYRHAPRPRQVPRAAAPGDRGQAPASVYGPGPAGTRT